MKEKRKKYGGRKKGTPNKKTLILQEHLDNMELNPIEGLRDCLNELEQIDTYEPEEKISLVKAKANIYLELLQYLFPKRKAVELQATLDSGESNSIVEIHWADEKVDADDSQNASQDASSKTNQREH